MTTGSPYLVDSHCHLNFKGLVDDLPAVLERARGAGVRTMLTIDTRLDEFDEVAGIAARDPDLFCSVGIHPHEAEDEREATVADITRPTANDKVVGIGETGLDYYYDNAPRAAQRHSFEKHIVAAQETGLPLIVHSRDAEEDTIELLSRGQQAGQGGISGVIHCFTGSQAFADAALDLGFYISLSGIVTFRNAKALQTVARDLPAERLLVETDSPYLAPEPHRGRRCEPAFVADTAAFLADLRGESVADLARYTTENFFTLFSKATPAEPV